jgi:Lrp/AsnC family leucine-responsive transcriptional regulator
MWICVSAAVLFFIIVLMPDIRFIINILTITAEMTKNIKSTLSVADHADKYKLDQTDLGILNLLQNDGLMTYKELASQLHKTMSPIAERVSRLRALGYIKKTVAVVDIHKIRPVFIAFPHVQLTSHSEDVLTAFQKEITRYPEVLECYHLTGHYDFMLKIVMPDMVSYNAFLREKLDKLPYISTIQSFLVLSAAKQETAYPL